VIMPATDVDPTVLAMLRAVASRLEGPYRMHAQRILADGEFVVVEGQGQNKLRLLTSPGN